MRWIHLLILLSYISCQEKKSDRSENSGVEVSANQQVEKAGHLFSNQSCERDPALLYSVYYPSDFNKSEKLPVFILFDPHGDPDVPIQKYQRLADAYSYILIASKDSKNGNGPEQTGSILQAIVYQTLFIEKADTNRIFTGGFSGGARVASMLALSPAGIKGLMLCGAGLPAGSWTGLPPHVIVALAGNSDMNLSEVINFKTADPRLMSRYQMIRFEGKHEWPPVDQVEDAFIAFDAIAQRDRFVEKDSAKLEKERATLNQHVDSLKNGIEKAEALKNIIKNFNGMLVLHKEEKELENLLKSPSYQQAIALEKQLNVQEERYRNYFLKALGSSDISWWEKEFPAWEKSAEKNKSREFVAMKNRIKGMLSLATYMSLTRSIAALHADQSLYLSHVYRLVDPENSEAWYLSSVTAAQSGNLGQCLDFLDIAIQKGFKDQTRCKIEPAFAAFQSDNRFQQMIYKIVN